MSGRDNNGEFYKKYNIDESFDRPAPPKAVRREHSKLDRAIRSKQNAAQQGKAAREAEKLKKLADKNSKPHKAAPLPEPKRPEKPKAQKAPRIAENKPEPAPKPEKQKEPKSPKPPKVRKPVSRGKKIALIATLSALGVILLSAAGISAYVFVFNRVGEVTNVKVGAITDSSVTLSWDRTDHADGYRIYAARGSGDYSEKTSVEGTDTLSANVGGLEQCERYSFYVTAYNSVSESSYYESVDNVYTLTKGVDLTELSVTDAGALQLRWQKNDRADGYIIEYKAKGEDYSDDNTKQVESADKVTALIDGVQSDTSYTVRVKAYIDNNGKRSEGDPGAEKSVSTGAEGSAVLPDSDKPMVALTFDDGPGGDSSERILNTLEKYGAKATFFMVGYNTTKYPDNLTRKVSLGMELGNHTWDHTHYGDNVTAGDIQNATAQIFTLTGQYPTAFRSPGGMTTDAIKLECSNEGMPLYYWTIDTEDWKSRNADSVYNKVIPNVKDGDIILMHEIYDSTADAVEKIVPELIEKGYQLVTCRELIQAKTGADPVAGVQYTSAKSE